MAKYSGHTYKWTKEFSIRHHWEFRSQHGGVHFHVSLPISGNYEPACGLELHSVYPRGDDAPDHINCPITGGRCWHDGTNLYAMETLWPIIKVDLARGNHEAIFSLLEQEAEFWSLNSEPSRERADHLQISLNENKTK